MDGRDDSVCLVDSDFLFDWTTTTALLAFFRAHERGWASLGWVGGWVGVLPSVAVGAATRDRVLPSLTVLGLPSLTVLVLPALTVLVLPSLTVLVLPSLTVPVLPSLSQAGLVRVRSRSAGAFIV